ncbi:sodium-extruding oxaloacetate decarboxylase subunit alpha [Gammaproteobacteria bacterium]|nr:sodium-extruding oxaloacetate decarboxylase subunit alpha [Gammaproteobacteria bacterium]MDB9909672.1 sodium-extruding oxaloacetate decarboxylase subunit alpha [Gammaproteobacteria bacterium]MDC3398578.1 sodium-extruding oxaloacetate decarboxylase subunit alpha [Gammaproteobacteria bacterium]
MTESNKIGVTEVVLRDGHQSLLATRFRYQDMEASLKQLDQVGFWSVESWGGAIFDSCIRYLGEDPWDRIRKIKSMMPNTPQQMLLRGQNLLGYKHYADDVVKKFVECSKTNGVDVFRVFDALNDPRNMYQAMQSVIEVEGHAQGTISYTTSPVHTIDLWVDLAKTIQDMGAHSLAIKDMAGLLKPYVAFELVSKLKESLEIPIHLHCHATTGMSVATGIKAIEAGLDNIDTSISSMSMTYGHSPTETIISILDGTNRDTGLDLDKLIPVAEHFQAVRKKYKNFEGSLRGVDARILASQVPGGMLTNLENQLKAQDSINRFDEVIQEIPRVRKDLGYIPLVTPTSQIVGTQAVINVLSNSRYSTVTNEVKSLLKGEYGSTPAPVSKDLQQNSIGDSAVISCRPADLISDNYNEIVENFNSALIAKDLKIDCSDENILTYAMFPEIGLAFLEHQSDPDFFETEPADILEQADSSYLVSIDDKEYSVVVKSNNSVEINGSSVKSTNEQPSHTAQAGLGSIINAPLGGNIFKLIAQEGQSLEPDATVLILEAMKMETEIKSPAAGVVTKIFVKPGDSVKPGDPLFEIA